MIVTPQTPFHEGSIVEESGALLPYADVLSTEDSGAIGIKVDTRQNEVILATDTLSTIRVTRAHIDPDDAEHLAHLLLAAARQAREW